MKDKKDNKRTDSAVSAYKSLPDRKSAIGFGGAVTPDRHAKKRVLITGAGSYVGESFRSYAKEHYADNFEVDTLDMKDAGWRGVDFGPYDVVFHVAGIAHKRVNEKDERNKKQYYAVNTRLAVEVAEKAKSEGIKHCVFMSSMSVYGNSVPYGKKKIITAATKPKAVNLYGDSKWQADKRVRRLADAECKVSVLRPPIVYGNGCRGNYQMLAKLAQWLPVFPDVDNERSMLYIENLCEFLCQLMLVPMEAFSEKGNVFFPQNLQYMKTSDMVRAIRRVHKKNIWITGVLKPFVWAAAKMPGRIGTMVDKAFGSFCYSKELSEYSGIEYQGIGMNESIKKTEIAYTNQSENRVLLLANHGLYIYNLRLELVERLLSEGYRVHISSPYSEQIEKLKKLGCFYHEVKINRHGMNPIEEFKLLKSYEKLIKDVNPKIILTYSIKPNIYGGMVCSRLGIPFIANVTGLGMAVEKGKSLKKALVFMYRLAFRRITKVFLQNTANAEFFSQNRIALGKHIILPGSGVNLSHYTYEPYPEEGEELIFITVGRIMEVKGTNELLEAAKKIKEKYPKVSFYMIGFYDGDYEELVETAVNEGVVCHIEQQMDVRPYYAKCHAIIHPGHYEGMSNVCLEAAATGRPILASRIHGCIETFDEGESGLRFEAGNAEDLVKTIEKFIKMPYTKKEEMGKAGRKKMEREFDREKVVDMYMKEIYRETN